MEKKKKIGVRDVAMIGMLGAVAAVLMLIQTPVPFMPPFYQLDLSEVPVLIGTFALGPVAGVLIEIVKIVLNLLMNATITFGVGELSNFLVGSSFCISAGMIYQKMKTKKGARISLVCGTLFMVTAACFINAFIVIPAYDAAMGGVISMASESNKYIKDMPTLIAFGTLPFNLLKGCLTSLIVLLVYKKISPILKRH